MGMEKCDKNAPALEVWSTEKYHQVIMLGNRRDTSCLAVDIASVPAFTWEELAAIMKNSHEDEIRKIFAEFGKIRAFVLGEAIPSLLLRKNAMYNSNIDFRYLVIHRLIDEGYIKLHDDMNKSAIGIYNITY